MSIFLHLKMTEWKQNLLFIWLSQFLSIAGFAFSIPFVPYFMQELGVSDPIELNFWVSIFGASAPLTLMVFSPIWGSLSDRFGRRIMVLRANFAGTVILGSMALVTDIKWLIVLRAMQGVFTGTMTASQTLVSASTPENRNGFALGILSAAVFSGMMFGNFAGGIFAELYGYRMAFVGSGILLLTAGLLVMFGVNEHFHRPEDTQQVTKHFSNLGKNWLKQIGPSAPILIMLLAISFVRHFDVAFLPLLIQEVQGSIKGAASITGALGAVAGVAGLLSGIIIGRLADTIHPQKLGKTSALFAGLLMIPHGLARGFLLIFLARFGMIFFSGGLDPIFQIWLAKVTPKKQRGFVFGWAGSAKAVGWMLAPLCSGVVASTLNIRWIYIVGCFLFLCLIPLISFVVRFIEKKQSTNPRTIEYN